MPKIKSNSSAKKRFRLTASGKIKRGKSHRSHILTKKSSKRKRHLRSDIQMVHDADVVLVKKMLPGV